MAKIGRQIIDKALELLREHPEGLRYSDLVGRIESADPTLKTNTIHGNVWNLHEQFPDKVYKPSRGLFRLLEFKDPESEQVREDLVRPATERVAEESFYEPFAEWLVNDLEECTKAIALGGNKFRDKWGTPDVIGKRESRRSDIIQAPIEIVSAEIKPEISQLVTAFGQACAYCLFSHKSYLVIPRQAPDDEVARVDGLCQVFGIGLVLFDSTKPSDPEFTIRARARYQQPDLFYANRYMKTIEPELFS